MTRREAREQAFCLVFEMDFQTASMEEIVEQARQCRDLDLEDYAAELAFKVAGSRQYLDEMITSFSTKWKGERRSTACWVPSPAAAAKTLPNNRTQSSDCPKAPLTGSHFWLIMTFGKEASLWRCFRYLLFRSLISL